MRESTHFFDSLAKFDDSVAVITESSERVTYRDLASSVDALKSRLERRTLVFCLCDNDLESLVGYLGALGARSVPVLLEVSIKRGLLDSLLEGYSPEYLWLPEELASELPGEHKITHRFGRYVLLKTSFVSDHLLHDELALMLTTSGSTGSPKFVKLTYANVTSNAESIAEYHETTADDRPITTLPMSYSYGLSIINSHLLQGASLILTKSTLVDRLFWQLFKEHNATMFGGVPFTYEMLAKLRFERMKLPSLRLITQAGGKLGKELIRQFAEIAKDKGFRFFVMYGQTEATARMSYLPWERALDKVGSIGIAIPRGEFWLEDEDGQIVQESNVSAELVYRGPNVSLGYAEHRRDLNAPDANRGVLRTGDIAYRDDEGFYFIAGRKKRFLKIFGSRVNLDEVERILHRGGHDAICSGMDDHLKIYATRRDRLREMKTHLLAETGINPGGIETVYVSEIPRNAAGKVLYSALP